MTDLLKDTLTRQAESAEPPTLDLDSVISAGNRRSRRRTVGTALGTTFVALAAVATGLTAVHALGNDNATAPASRPAAPYTEHRPTYAIGNVIHYGAETIQADAKVTAIMQTGDGLLYATGDYQHVGRVTVLDGSGKHVLSSPTHYPTLTSDGHSVVSWFEDAKTGEPNGAQVVYDVANHRTIRRLPIDAKTMNALAALDRGYGYIWVGTRLDRLDLRSGDRTTVNKDVGGRSILGIAGSTYLYTEQASDTTRMLYVGDLSQGGRRAPLGLTRGDHPWRAVFSPDGKQTVSWQDDGPLGRLQVHTSAGKDLPIRVPAYTLQSFAGWLGNDRFAMVAAKGSKAPADLLTCSTADGTCTVTRQNIAPSMDQNIVVPTR